MTIIWTQMIKWAIHLLRLLEKSYVLEFRSKKTIFIVTYYWLTNDFDKLKVLHPRKNYKTGHKKPIPRTSITINWITEFATFRKHKVNSAFSLVGLMNMQESQEIYLPRPWTNIVKRGTNWEEGSFLSARYTRNLVT